MSRFSRRTATGYYKPLSALTNYGIELADHMLDSSIWTVVPISPTCLSITSNSTIESIDANPGGDIAYWKALAAPLGDSFASIEFSGFVFTPGGGAGHDSFFSCEGGPAVRCNGTTWPAISCYAAVWSGNGFTGTIVWGWKVYRLLQNGASTTIQTIDSGSFGAGVTPAAGDLMRLDVLGSSTGTHGTLKVNGSTLSTWTDASISAVNTGYPGVGGAFVAQNGGSKIAMKNWRGGALSPVIPYVPSQWQGSGYWLGAR